MVWGHEYGMTCDGQNRFNSTSKIIAWEWFWLDRVSHLWALHVRLMTMDQIFFLCIFF